MPRTKKEEFYFGLMMCTGMVVFMTFYNLTTKDLWRTMSVPGILLQLVMGFVAAFTVESFIVGPLAKKIAFCLRFARSNKVLGIVTLSFFMVTGMVILMSLFGMGMSAIFADGLAGESFVESYLKTISINYIFALPLQLIIVGPVVRSIFVKMTRDGSALVGS
ncbi:hypothetical protein COHCIP112018_05442 [Cohnella sp. JJ-181]|nr:hypothetical protein [Cohnella sp. JJ-181]CAI6087309.1 hypothetical protein COHCIP112018_05442 [Cohnella sp. JJ-181]